MIHFLLKEVKSLRDIALTNPLSDLRLICGGNEMIVLANLPYGLKREKSSSHNQIRSGFCAHRFGVGPQYAGFLHAFE